MISMRKVLMCVSHIEMVSNGLYCKETTCALAEGLYQDIAQKEWGLSISFQDIYTTTQDIYTSCAPK